MKKVLLTAAMSLMMCVGVYAQDYTQKWNSLYQRTEYYDTYGNMIGYSKYNELYKRNEYYDAIGNLKKTESYNNIYNRTEIKKQQWQPTTNKDPKYFI